jgi:MFS family permease
MVKNTGDLVGTLTVGNVVSTATTLYKSNFKRYFQVSLRATGWGLAILLAAIGLAFIGGLLYGLTKSWLVAVPLGLGWIVFTLYCSARSATDMAVIARLAYQELIDTPETVSEATQQLLPKTWAFFRLLWLVAASITLVAIVGYFLLILIVGIAVGIISALKLLDNPIGILLLVIIGIGLLGLYIWTLLRYCSYWFVAELPLAIESSRSAGVSMRRSRDLSRSAIGRLQLIIFIAYLITLPITTLTQLPLTIGQVMVNPVASSETQAIGMLLIVVGLVLTLISGLFVVPFWQAIKATIYYDLRNRREGRDLML